MKENDLKYSKINILIFLLIVVFLVGSLTYLYTIYIGGIKNTILQDLIMFLEICIIIIFLMLCIFILINLYYNKKIKKIYETAYIDPITKLGNENYFKENGEQLLFNYNKNCYTLIVDINQFTILNKMYDYTFCNKILKQFGQDLKQALPKNNVVCRISRDTFACVMAYSSDIEKVINRIFKITDEFKVDNLKLKINLSIGVYKTNVNDKNINAVLDKTFMAYAKNEDIYNNSYFIFDNDLEDNLLQVEQMELEMEDALTNNEFEVVYQPKISTKDETLIGAEALVRWHKGKKIILPDKFIPVFEKNKFIINLDLYVFEKVCKDMQAWKMRYGIFPNISVNISKEHFTNKNFIKPLVEITDKYKIDRSKIELEITESRAIYNDIDYVKIINKIKQKGFIVSIDDFGTGYSSLSMLQQMPIDIIKIDKSFIDNADLQSDKNMINYIVFMAKQLDVKTIAEGVETKEQVEFIKKIKCDMIQGFYYSKPLNINKFNEYLEQKLD